MDGRKKDGRKALVELINCSPDDQDSRVVELQRLIASYQIASRDDRNVVWAVLNKYASQIDKI